MAKSKRITEGQSAINLTFKTEYRDMLEVFEQITAEIAPKVKPLLELSTTEVDESNNLITYNHYLNNAKQLVVSESVAEYGDRQFKIHAETKLQNEANTIDFSIKRVDGHLQYGVKTLASGLLSMDDFFTLAQYMLDHEIDVVSAEEDWLTPQVARGLLSLKDRLKGNKIANGMRKTPKELGRPVDDSKVQRVFKLYKSGDYTLDEIAEMSGVSRTTVYRYLKKEGLI